MSELEDKISSLLSNPEEMGKLARLASKFMDGGLSGASPSPKEPAEDGLDPSMMSTITAAMKSLGGGNKKALLEGLSPYLGEQRRRKLEKALRVAQVAKLAGTAFSEFGGD